LKRQNLWNTSLLKCHLIVFNPRICNPHDARKCHVNLKSSSVEFIHWGFRWICFKFLCCQNYLRSHTFSFSLLCVCLIFRPLIIPTVCVFCMSRKYGEWERVEMVAGLPNEVGWAVTHQRWWHAIWQHAGSKWNIHHLHNVRELKEKNHCNTQNVVRQSREKATEERRHRFRTWRLGKRTSEIISLALTKSVMNIYIWMLNN
jgi:hypothetical protein